MVKVYSLPSCVQCNMTKRVLSQNDIPFEEISLIENEDARKSFQARGFLSAPIVEFPDGEVISGFRPEKLVGQAA